MQFKTIEAKFRVKTRTYDYEFTIERKVSGAFAYGNRSCHILIISDFKTKKQLRDEYYDTRYDSIPTEKGQWVNFWTRWIKNNWTNNP